MHDSTETERPADHGSALIPAPRSPDPSAQDVGVLLLTASLWGVFHQDGCRFPGVFFANPAKHLHLPTIAEYTKSGKG